MLPASEDNSISDIFPKVCLGVPLPNSTKNERINMFFKSTMCWQMRGIFHMRMIEKRYISKQ